MRLDERKEVLALVQQRVGADDVVGEGAQAGCLGGGRRMHLEDVPDILVGALERTEANADAEQALATPAVAGHDAHLADTLCLAAVHGHLDLLVQVRLEQLLERVIVPVQSRRANGHDKVKERLQASPRAGRVLLDLKRGTGN